MKMTGELVKSKPVSLSRAAKLISRFATVDNGSTPTVSVYLHRTADAFNRLHQFHDRQQQQQQQRFHYEEEEAKAKAAADGDYDYDNDDDDSEKHNDKKKRRRTAD